MFSFLCFSKSFVNCERGGQPMWPAHFAQTTKILYITQSKPPATSNNKLIAAFTWKKA
jgi:hypothetical protein